MNKKNILILILLIFLILTLPLMVLLFNFNIISFNENFYKKEFGKNNVYDNLKEYDIEKINSNVLNYIKKEKTKNKLIEEGFFSEREKKHLLDVKKVITNVNYVYYSSILIFFLLLPILYFLFNNLKKSLKFTGFILICGSSLIFLFSLIFFILININFDFFFAEFHKIFFESGTYLFDSSFENIVNLYPEQIFLNIAQRIFVYTLIQSFILLIVGIFLLIKIKFKRK